MLPIKNESKRYHGRDFSAVELTAIRSLIRDNPTTCRTQLSRIVCDMLNWRQPNGNLKQMACRVAMLRMQDDGLIQLPPTSRRNGNGKPYRRRTQQAEPQPQLRLNSALIADLNLELVSKGPLSHLWNEYIDRYHYLRYSPLPGAQLRYFAKTNNQIVALLGFGSAAWKTAPRDLFIGWTSAQRERHLHLVINNARFMILPWVTSPNLASKILAMVQHQLPQDWQKQYGFTPVLIETFVEKQRFHGTCYKGANWICVGETKGRGRDDKFNKVPLPKKTIWIYPIIKGFRRHLCE